MSRPPRPNRADFVWFKPLPTRWLDNDMYGHVNNIVYHSYFDTAIGYLLIEECGFEPVTTPVLDYVVENGCRYHLPVGFPDLLHIGLRVGRLGTSSIRWELGLFRNDDVLAAADGHFVHVFVDRQTQRPVPMPETIRHGLARLGLIAG